MLGVLLETANIPTRDDIDEIYKELHSLRKLISKLEKNGRQTKVKNNGK